MHYDSTYHLDLHSLIEDDLSSYEFYMSLSNDLRQKLEEADIHTFEDLQTSAYELKQLPGLIY